MEKNEIAIDVKDMFRRILKRWYLLIIAFILGAAIGAVYDYTNNADMELDNSEATEQSSSDEDKISFDAIQDSADIRNYVSNYQLLQYYNNYVNNSVLMNADTSAMLKRVLTYQIETDNESDFAAFFNIMLDEEAIDEVNNKTGIAKPYVSELFTFHTSGNLNVSNDQVSTANNQASTVNDQNSADSDQNDNVLVFRDDTGKLKFLSVVTVEIIAGDEKQSEQLAKVVDDLFDRKMTTIANSDIVLTKSGDYSQQYQDESLANKKVSVYQNLQNAITNTKSAYEQLSDDEKALADKIIASGGYINDNMKFTASGSDKAVSDSTDEMISEAEESAVQNHFNKKHIAAAGILFLLLTVVIEILLYISDQKVKTDNELSDSWHMDRLGIVKNDEMMQNCLRSIASVVTKRNENIIYLADEANTAGSQNLCEQLQEMLNGKKVVFGTIKESGCDISDLTSADSVIILSKTGRTERKEVKAVMDACRLSETKLLGFVAF